jgi:hypothetical protein
VCWRAYVSMKALDLSDTTGSNAEDKTGKKNSVFLPQGCSWRRVLSTYTATYDASVISRPWTEIETGLLFALNEAFQQGFSTLAGKPVNACSVARCRACQ